MSQNPRIQLLLSGLGAWMLIQILLRFGGIFVTAVLVLLVGSIAATIYALRFEKRRLAPYYQRNGYRQFIDLVCKLSRQQPPIDSLAAAGTSALRLKIVEDFDWLRDRLKSELFGHDNAIDVAVGQLQKNVLLRQHSESKAELPPLAFMLLVGPRGIGKRMLATRIGQRLFDNGQVTALDLANYGDNETAVVRLFGAAGREGDLTGPVKMRPYHTLILANLESAAPRALAALQSLAMSGCCVDGSHGGTVSFQNCVIVATSTSVPPGLADLDDVSSERLLEAFCAHTECPESLLGSANACLLMKAPDSIDKARAILQLMMQECRKYQLSLEYVEPAIIADEVRRYSEVGGFEHSKIRIARWLSNPIHLASSHGLDSLVLTADLINTGANAAQEVASPLEVLPAGNAER